MTADRPHTPALSLREVRKSYPGSPPVESVRGVTLDVMPGELAAIVGPSGSGKSTLMHLRPAQARRGHVNARAGRSRRAGREIAASGSTTRLHLPGLHLFPALTALDHVATALRYKGMAQGGARPGARRDRVGLAPRMHQPPQLSGGEKQRVAIARALAGAQPGVRRRAHRQPRPGHRPGDHDPAADAERGPRRDPGRHHP